MKLTDDVKQRKQKHFKQYRTAKQKLTNKENLVRFLHRGKPASAYYWRKVAQGRTLYTLTVELSTWLSCSLHSSFVAQMLWHGCGVYTVDQRCEILTNKFESLDFCWLCFRRADE